MEVLPGMRKGRETVSEEKTKLFIRRERIRRNLIKTNTGESICLQDWEVKILLDWIKELEREVKKDGNQSNQNADFKGKVKGYWG